MHSQSPVSNDSNPNNQAISNVACAAVLANRPQVKDTRNFLEGTEMRTKSTGRSPAGGLCLVLAGGLGMYLNSVCRLNNHATT